MNESIIYEDENVMVVKGRWKYDSQLQMTEIITDNDEYFKMDNNKYSKYYNCWRKIVVLRCKPYFWSIEKIDSEYILETDLPYIRKRCRYDGTFYLWKDKEQKNQ